MGVRLVTKPAYLNENVVDAIGAGDSFNAGFINRFINHKPLDECLDFGALCGALNTTAAGGIGAFQSLETVKASMKQRFNKTFDN